MLFKKIYKMIKKYDTIVIARHIGSDPDALGSTIGLKEAILYNFPNKKVYTVGSPASRFKYIGNTDKLDEINFNNSLLIVTDTPDKKRIDGIDVSKFGFVIKIDHHPFIEKYADIELIDDNASSASQLIIELIKINNMKINDTIASKLFIGVVADTNRFLYSYTSFKTFELVSWLIKKTDLNFTQLYPNLYNRPFKEIKFLGYIASNLIITENGLGYLKITDEILKNYEVDPSTAGNLIENLNNIQEVKVIALCSEDKGNNYIKCSIRSKGPIINELLTDYNGGGHMYACGARPKNFDDVDIMLKDLDELCKNY